MLTKTKLFMLKLWLIIKKKVKLTKRVMFYI